MYIYLEGIPNNKEEKELFYKLGDIQEMIAYPFPKCPCSVPPLGLGNDWSPAIVDPLITEPTYPEPPAPEQTEYSFSS